MVVQGPHFVLAMSRGSATQAVYAFYCWLQSTAHVQLYAQHQERLIAWLMPHGDVLCCHWSDFSFLMTIVLLDPLSVAHCKLNVAKGFQVSLSVPAAV